MDEMVKRTQVYLNAMYGGNSGYEVIPENGITGWTTIYALTRALQIELGITATADSFGPTTISKFNSKFPNGIKQQNSSDTKITYMQLFKGHYGVKAIQQEQQE